MKLKHKLKVTTGVKPFTGFTIKFYQIFKDQAVIFLEMFHKVVKRDILPNSAY